MYTVTGENARLFVFLVVLQVVIKKGLSQIDQGNVMTFRKRSDNIAVVVQISIQLIAGIRFFSNSSGRTKRNPDISFLKFFEGL